jgi:hypothetical protein
MKYPESFSSDTEAAVEAEKILATEDFSNQRNDIGPSYYDSSRVKLRALVRKYIVRVTLAFARQACILGRARVWTVAQVDLNVRAFLFQVAREAEHEKSFYADGDWLRDASFTSGHAVLAQEMHHISTSPEWKEYQEELLAVATIQKTTATVDPSGFEDTPEAALQMLEDILNDPSEEAKGPSPNDEIARRLRLLEEYKSATGQPSNQRIYRAKNSGIHKPQFHEWLKGVLPSASQTSVNFERFLREKKQPIPRNPKD